MALSFWKDSALRIRGQITTAGIHGEKIDWSNPNTLPLIGIQITAKSGADSDGRLTEQWSLLAPLLTDVRRKDRIEWMAPSGEKYLFTINGRPMPHRSPYGMTEHLRVNLEVHDG